MLQILKCAIMWGIINNGRCCFNNSRTGNTYTHNFSVPYNFSTAGNYILKVEVENTTGIDPVSANNSITDTISQLNNDPITLPFIDNLESATHVNIIKIVLG